MIQSINWKYKYSFIRPRDVLWKESSYFIIIVVVVVVFQGSGLLACSGSEFVFWNLWMYWTVGRTPWTGNQPDAKPLPTQDNTTRKSAETDPFEWDSNPRPQCSSDIRQLCQSSYLISYFMEFMQRLKRNNCGERWPMTNAF